MLLKIKRCPLCDGEVIGVYKVCKHCAIKGDRLLQAYRARSKRTLVNDLKSVGTEGEDDEVKETRIL
jgi:hypothetical protein